MTTATKIQTEAVSLESAMNASRWDTAHGQRQKCSACQLQCCLSKKRGHRKTPSARATGFGEIFGKNKGKCFVQHQTVGYSVSTNNLEILPHTRTGPKCCTTRNEKEFIDYAAVMSVLRDFLEPILETERWFPDALRPISGKKSHLLINESARSMWTSK